MDEGFSNKLDTFEMLLGTAIEERNVSGYIITSAFKVIDQRYSPISCDSATIHDNGMTQATNGLPESKSLEISGCNVFSFSNQQEYNVCLPVEPHHLLQYCADIYLNRRVLFLLNTTCKVLVE